MWKACWCELVCPLQLLLPVQIHGLEVLIASDGSPIIEHCRLSYTCCHVVDVVVRC